MYVDMNDSLHVVGVYEFSYENSVSDIIGGCAFVSVSPDELYYMTVRTKRHGFRRCSGVSR